MDEQVPIAADGDGRADGRRAFPPLVGSRNDPGLIALGEAETAYRVLLAQLEAERSAAERMRAQAVRQSERVDKLLTAVREMHRALYHGSTADFVLRAAMELTDAERGYYVSRTDEGLVIRAVVDVPAAVGDRPSVFIRSIVERVLTSGKATCWDGEGPPGEALLAAGPSENFSTGAAVPVSVRGDPRGVLIVLDKDGRFDHDDIDSLLSVGSQAGVAIENSNLRREVQQAYVGTIAVLADAVEAKDPYTMGHCQRVSRYAGAVADRLGLSEADHRVVCYAALLHDIGKIGVSDGVLNKPGPLLEEERRLVEAHVRIGHDILTHVPALRDVATAILHHHERFDGQGYPEGRAGESIPIASRIVAAVDAYCAMLDRRSYKEPMPSEEARAELRRCAGTQFDPAVIEALLPAIDDIDAQYDVDETPGADCGLLPAISAPPAVVMERRL